MKKCYLIELGGEKEIHEMKALELDNINEAIDWIKDSMASDEDYFNIDIDCKIQLMEYTQFSTELDFYAQAFVYIDAETIVTEEMFTSQVYSVDTIIKSNLSIVSKIVAKGELKEVSD